MSPSDPSTSTGEVAAQKVCQEEAVTLIESIKDLGLVTSLMYHYFNESDSNDVDESNQKTYNMIKQWKDLNARLLELHTRRLRTSAEAADWTDVALILTPTSKYRNHDRNETSSYHESQREPPEVNLLSLLEQEATRHATHAGISPPSQGTMRSHKVRILTFQTGNIHIEIAAPSTTSEVTHSLSAIIANYTSCPLTLDVEGPTSLITIDTESTVPSLFTRHKTTHRTVYDTTRARAVPRVPPTALPTAREVLLFNTHDEIMEASVSSVYFHRAGTWVTPSSRGGGMQSVTKMYALEKGWCTEGIVTKDSVTDGEIVWLGNAVRGFFAGKILVTL